MKKPWIWIVLGVVLVGALVAVNVAQQNKGKAESVQIAKIRREDVTSRVRAPGKIEPKTQVKVSADVPGKVMILGVKEGDHVRTGQLLLQIDDVQYRAAHHQAQAALASAQARLREAQSALKTNEANFVRQRSLFDQKLLSQAEWDQAQNVHEGALVALSTAQEEATRARAAVEGAADNVSKCRFVAPFDGVVSALNVEKGEIVITGTMNNPGTQIMVVSDLSKMLVRADVDETDVVDMKVGQKAKISVDAFPDTTFAGVVTEIGNTAKRSALGASDNQTNFEVKVVFDENVPQVRPGMTADVEIETGTQAKTLAVPIQAVVVRTQRDLDQAAKRTQRGGRAEKPKRGAAITADEDTIGRREKEITGLFAVKDNVARFVQVRTGIASETMIEIFGEVKEGEEVVAGPYKALRELKPGGKVKREAAAKAKK